jgi:hypothetical protein
MKFCEEAVEKASSISAIEGTVAEKIEAGFDDGVLGDIFLLSVGELSRFPRRDTRRGGEDERLAKSAAVSRETLEVLIMIWILVGDAIEMGERMIRVGRLATRSIPRFRDLFYASLVMTSLI